MLLIIYPLAFKHLCSVPNVMGLREQCWYFIVTCWRNKTAVCFRIPKITQVFISAFLIFIFAWVNWNPGSALICSLERCESTLLEEPPMCWELGLNGLNSSCGQSLSSWQSQEPKIFFLHCLWNCWGWDFHQRHGWVQILGQWHFPHLSPSHTVVEISKQSGCKGEGRFWKSLPFPHPCNYSTGKESCERIQCSLSCALLKNVTTCLEVEMGAG